ncbi:MAG TPA: FAD-dependent oxidoreductase, partial [Bacteroidales bacterium]|nr:FAD-dependent oxidoreductase [Bacteroidales bacterium]
TTRLQPVVLQIGQAAGALAAISVKKKIPVGTVDIRLVQDAILEAKGYLLPYLDYPVEHPWFQSLQRIGSTGILKGIGKNAGWSNQTWFRAETFLLYKDLKGLLDVYPSAGEFTSENTVTVDAAIKLLEKIARKEKLSVSEKLKKEAFDKAFRSGPVDTKRNITRGEMAVLIDILLDPFHHKPVDIKGNFIKN